MLKRFVKSIVLKALCFKQCAYKHCNKSTVLKVAVSTVLKAMCYKQCAICTVLKAPCKKCCAIGHCYYFSGTSLQTLTQLGLIQGNSRCFGANFQMSQNTHFLCLFFELKYSSVLFFLRFCISALHDNTICLLPSHLTDNQFLSLTLVVV